MVEFFFHVLIISIVLCNIFCVPFINKGISDQYVKKYEGFEYDIPLHTFDTDDGSNVRISLDPNPWVSAGIRNASIEAEYAYIRGEYPLVVGDILFLTDSNLYGVRIFNISKISDFVYLGSFKFLSDHKSKIVIDSDFMLIAAGYDGLLIVDISDLRRPELVGTYSYEGFFIEDLVVGRNPPYYVYTVGRVNDVQLSIIDVSDKKNPVMVGNCETEYSYSVIIDEQEELAFVADGGYGLKIINISVASKPFIVSAFAWSGPIDAQKLSFKDNTTLIISQDAKGFIFIDISNSSNPEELGYINTYGFVKYFVLVEDNNFLLHSNNDDGYRILNITDLQHLTELERVTGVSLQTLGLFREDVVLYLADYTQGVKILNISDFLHPILLAEQTIMVGDIAQSLDIFGDYLFVADKGGGVKVHSLQEKGRLPLIGKFSTHLNENVGQNIDFLRIHLKDHRIFVIDKLSGLIVLNYTLSQNGKEVSITQPYNASFVDRGEVVYIQDEFAYVSFHDGMKIFDIKINSYSPFEVGTFYTASIGINDIVVHENKFVYLVRSSSLWVINVTNKTNPFFVCELDLFRPMGLAIDFPYLFIADSSDGLKVVDITISDHPSLIGGCDTINAKSVSVDGDLALVADQEGGLRVIDISEKSNPIEILSVETPSSSSTSVFGRDNFVYLADGRFGLKRIKLDILLKGNSETFSYFCGDTEVMITAKDSSGQISTSFNLHRDDYCNDQGKCLPLFQCSCERGYEGSNCETWECNYVDFKLVTKACSGRGDCVAPNKCNCRGGYTGEYCETNILYGAVLAPILSLTVICLILGLVSCLYVCCSLCCTGVAFLCLSLFGCSFFAIRQTFGLRKFARLRNFELLLKEQEMEDDISMATLRFKKSLFEIDFDDLKTESILGEGGSNSIVLKANWKGMVVAFKCFKTRTIMGTQDHYNEFEREVEIMGSLSHPSIIRFFGACLKPPRVGIVMEYCSKGEILNFVRDFRTTYSMEYPIPQKIRLCFECVQGIEFLHSKKIIHRDLKCENVLISEEEHAKLMDFGLSRVVDRMSRQKKTHNIGTNIYMSPEIVLTQKNYDEKCDVFSLAMMIFILFLEDDDIYPGIDTYRVELSVASDPNFRPDVDRLDTMPELKNELGWLKNLVRKCWDHDPSKRFSCSEILQILEKRETESAKIHLEEEEKEDDSHENNIIISSNSDNINSEKELLIEKLRREIESQKQEIEKMRNENLELRKKLNL